MDKIKQCLAIVFILSFPVIATAQVAINKDGSTADSAAILQVKGDNKGTPVQAMYIESGTGNVGIGTTTPGFPLTFKNVFGDKISLYGQAGDNWGFGIQYHLFQIHGKNSSSNIAFGYGSSSNFTELMRITGTGQVGIGTSTPESSALLEINSTEKGFLPPRMTTAQMNAIVSPAEGLTIYNTDKEGLCYYNSTQWKCMDDQSLSNLLFICGKTYLDTETGYSFSTVKIGSQCWMAENLNVGTRINGSQDQTNNNTIEKYCYNDSTTNCDTYGGLYQWDEMMQYVTTAGAKGICPNGWHLPTDNEWKTMEMYLGMSQAQADATGWRGTDEGGKLKETGTTHWHSPNTGATNSSGFTGLPGGYRGNDGSFYDLGTLGGWWSSTEGSGTNAWIRRLRYEYNKVYRYNYYKAAVGRSVRCLKDD